MQTGQSEPNITRSAPKEASTCSAYGRTSCGVQDGEASVYALDSISASTRVPMRDALRAVVVIALGAFAWSDWWPALSSVYSTPVPRPLPRFGHGALWTVESEASSGGHVPTLLGSYHVSQQNTFTGRLTPAMLDDVLSQAIALAK